MESFPSWLPAHFGLVPVRFEKLSNGSSNDNWLCQTKTGRYVIKRTYISNIRHYMSYQKWLAVILEENKFPYAGNFYYKNKICFIKKYNSLWMMRSFVDGRFHQLGNSEDNQECVKTLLALHRIKAGGKRYIPDFIYWSKNAEKKLKYVEKVVAYYAKDDAFDMMEHYRHVLNDLATSNCFMYKYESTITHGDYHSGNIIFGDNGIKAVIDWDTSAIAPRITDLARATFLLTRKKHGAFEPDMGLALEFLRKYDADAPLSDHEISIIPLYLSVAYIPKPEYLKTFHDEEKLKWYVNWTYNASKSSANIQPIINEFIKSRKQILIS